MVRPLRIRQKLASVGAPEYQPLGQVGINEKMGRETGSASLTRLGRGREVNPVIERFQSRFPGKLLTSLNIL